MKLTAKEAIREFSETIYSGLNPILQVNKEEDIKGIADMLTTLISEHFVAKEEVDAVKSSLPPAGSAERIIACPDCRAYNKITDKEMYKCWNCGVEFRYLPNGLPPYHCVCGAVNPGEKQPTAEGAEEKAMELAANNFANQYDTKSAMAAYFGFKKGVKWIQAFAAQEVAARIIQKPTDNEISDEAYETNQIKDEHGQFIWKYAFDDDQSEAFITGAKWALGKVAAIEMPTDEEAEEQAQSLYKAGMDLADESPISYTHKQLCLHEAQGHRAGAGWFRSRMEGESK